MRQNIQTLLAAGLVTLSASSAMAQTPAAGAGQGAGQAAGQAAPRGTGPYGGANAVQPGAGANQANPAGQPNVPRAGVNPQGSGPYGGANAALPQQPSSPTGTTPQTNVAGNANGAGPYGGFNAVQPPALVPAAPFTPSLAFPGAGIQLFNVQQGAVNFGAFPGQNAVNGVLSGLPTGAAAGNSTANPAMANGIGTPQGNAVAGQANTANVAQQTGAVGPNANGQINPPQTNGNAQGAGPYGGANAVLPQQPASPTGAGVATPTPGAASTAGPYGGFQSVQPPSFTPNRPTLGDGAAGAVTGPQTVVNPVFTRFFAGLNAAQTPSVQTPTVQPVNPTP